MKRDDIVREVMSMRGCGYRIAKAIVLLAAKPPETFQQIGPSGAFARETGLRCPMSQAEAARIRDAAVTRIELVDEGG